MVTFESISQAARRDPQAEKISNSIDEELKKESARLREARRREVKVMLLGQAESGKSTLQKNFQLYYSQRTLDHERPSWRPVVYFNIIKAIRMILDELEYEFSSSSSPTTPTGSPTTTNNNNIDMSETAESEINDLRTRLLPLLAMEASLAAELGGLAGRGGFYVRSGWQSLISKGLSSLAGGSHSNSNGNGMHASPAMANLAGRTLHTSKDLVLELWEHHTVKALFRARRIRLEESAPFFLDSIERISQPDYVPSIDDILNVRLQTLGVVEHHFKIDMFGVVYDWKMYDVGGARGQRHAWIPFFDDATAIIFLAPISAFDQYLDEDSKINRIDDSLQLFTAICSNKLLEKAHLVLLLNKADLLKKKLASGVRVKRYITSYGDRQNDYENVSSYFKAHFVQVHRKKDSKKRTLFVHFTSMLDIQATRSIIVNVGESIIRKHIADSGLLP
ncbi:guanine nucleotide binding protein, alpha subunit [Flagelloscypha sp. PMI_526]|nr:guanine nucleotide binding protein, alpha subunit [Flagelloscypha sp. PMI_526]